MSDMPLRELFEGQLLERRYRLVRLLSEGNFGGVFHARLEIFGEAVRDVAVKVTKQAQLDRDTARSIFGEAMTLIRIYDQITDPEARQYIVPIHDLGLLESHDQRGFIVMGLIRGLGSTAERILPPDTLAAEMARYRGGVPADMAVAFFRQICRGLAAVHGLGVVHRDLKPDNILLTDRGQIRIVDFGLAAGLNDLGFAPGVAGTHRYMAPETALHAQSDPSSDVYSLGLILYEMLTGADPFARLVPPPSLLHPQREVWLVEQKRRLPLKPPRDIQRQIPLWLSELTLDCLKFHPSQGRPANAGALLQRLEEGPRGRAAQVAAEMARVDEFLAEGWDAWFRGDRDWQTSAERLQAMAAQCRSNSEPQWFEIMARLALCQIQLEAPSQAYEVLQQLEVQIEKGLFLGSYAERADFYEGLARLVQGKRGMQHWAIGFDQKARAARARAARAQVKR